MARVLLMIAGQAALFDEPAEASLDDPTARQHDEALLVFELFDDAQPKTRAMTEESSHAMHEGFEFACVAAIGKDHEQTEHAVAKHAQQELRSISVLHARWRDHDAQQQAIGVGERVTLATFDFFARIITTTHSR